MPRVPSKLHPLDRLVKVHDHKWRLQVNENKSKRVIHSGESQVSFVPRAGKKPLALKVFHVGAYSYQQRKGPVPLKSVFGFYKSVFNDPAIKAKVRNVERWTFPEVLDEKDLPDGRRAVLLEGVFFPSIVELVQAEHGHFPVGKRGELIQSFVEQNQAHMKGFAKRAGEVQRDITNALAGEYAGFVNPYRFVFHEDSIQVKEFTKSGKMVLVVLDIR